MTRNSVSKNKSQLAADAGSFGKSPLQSWIGKIVPFKDQEQQVITGGVGWRYKVRIMGDHSDNDNIPDKELDYAFVLLPTTAGSGGGGRIRTPRIVQGDMVYGVYGGGDSTGIRLIIGVFPRTDTITYKKVAGGGKFDPIPGWFGDLKASPITQQNQVNQANLVTPNDVQKINYSNRELSADRLAEMGIPVSQDGKGPAANAVTPPPKTPADKEWVPGTPITSQQLDHMIENNSDLVHDAYDQAIKQGIRSSPEKREIERMERIMEGEKSQQDMNLQELYYSSEETQ